MPVSPVVKQERQQLTEDKTKKQQVCVKQRTRWQLVGEERISKHRTSSAQRNEQRNSSLKPKPLNKKLQTVLRAWEGNLGEPARMKPNQTSEESQNF